MLVRLASCCILLLLSSDPEPDLATTAQCPIPPRTEYIEFVLPALEPLRIHQVDHGATSGKVWEAGMILAHAMTHQLLPSPPHSWARKRVIELGSGTGLVGLVGAAVAASKAEPEASGHQTQVLLTDQEVGLLVENARTNAEHYTYIPAAVNSCQPLAAHQEPERIGVGVSVQKLIWGDAESILKARQWKTDTDSDELPFDLILCSDLVYRAYGLQPLLQTMHDLARHTPDGECDTVTVALLAYTERDRQATHALEQALRQVSGTL